MVVTCARVVRSAEPCQVWAPDTHENRTDRSYWPKPEATFRWRPSLPDWELCLLLGSGGAFAFRRLAPGFDEGGFEDARLYFAEYKNSN